MSRVAVLATLVLLSPLIAGCLEALPSDEPAEPLNATAPVGPEAAAEAAVATASNATTDSWYVVNATAGPEGDLVSFWWGVPEGSVVEDGIWGQYDTVALEVAFLPPAGAAPDADLSLAGWGLFSFVEGDERGDELSLLTSYLDVPVQYEGDMLLVLPIEDDHEPTLEPFHLRLGFDQVREGDAVGFVLAARADEATDFRLAFRVLEEDPGFDADPAAGPAQFLETVGGAAPTVLPAAALATGFHADFRIEVVSAFLLPYSYVATAGEVETEGGMLVDGAYAGGVRDQSVHIVRDTRGWTYSYGLYFANDAVGEWAADVDAHGESIAPQGRVVQAWTVPAASVAGPLLWGLPLYVAVGEGDSGAHSSMSLRVANSNAGGFELWQMLQFGFGATIEELLGVPGEAGAFAWTGLLGEGVAALALGDGGTLHRIQPGPGGSSTAIRGAVPPERPVQR